MAKMKISLEKLMKALSLKHISGKLEREASSVYVGDMLSWVMSHASPDCIWVTIMSNTNVIAVASLVDTACVILTEDVCFDNNDIRLADEKGVCVFTTPMTSYEVCEAIALIDGAKS